MGAVCITFHLLEVCGNIMTESYLWNGELSPGNKVDGGFMILRNCKVRQLLI